MVLGSNAFVSDGSVIRSRKENGSCSFLPRKWKPRSVSAVRHFPQGCGPIVEPVNVVSQEADACASLQVDNNGVKDAQTSRIHVESLSNDGLKHAEDGRVEPLKAEVEPLVNKEDNQAVVMEDANGPVNNVDDVKPESVNGGNVFKGNVQRKKFPQRRVSAVRDFPPFCGLDAADPTEEERIRIHGNRRFGAKEEGDGRNASSIEAKVVGGEEFNMTVNKKFPKKTQSDERNVDAKMVGGKKSNKSVKEQLPRKTQSDERNVSSIEAKMVGGEESNKSFKKKLPWKAQSDERSTEKMIVGGEESNKDIQDSKVEKFERDVSGVELKELDTLPQEGDGAMEGQGCLELVVYTGDKVPKKQSSVYSCGKHSKGKFEDESVPNSEEQKDSKKTSGQIKKVGKGKRINKRPLDDTNDLAFPRGEAKVVLSLMASSLSPTVEKHPTNANDSTKKRKAKPRSSATPKKSTKKTQSFENVAYTGTLDIVLRDEEDFGGNIEERREDYPLLQGPEDVEVALPRYGPKSSSDARDQVRETLRYFQALCRKLLQGEEAKTGEGGEPKSLFSGKRIDLAALKLIKEKGRDYDLGMRTFGPVPGVEVGDEFQYRVELALVGIHRVFQAGIDYTKQGKEIFAVSVVASGGYDDELDNPDSLIYSGAGGVGKDKQIGDQKLERGNLALKNNILHKHPVRVVRGYKGKAAESSDSKSKVAITYIYDGLYSVDRYWQEPGPLGNLVFKFELKRIPGQPELALREVKKSKKSKIREGVCVDDITGGKEVFRICAVNTVDHEKPPHFNYITKMIYPDWYRPVPPQGCGCVGRCSDKRCPCAFKNGGEIPYNHNGAIVEAKPLVYECGPSCKCPPTCYNRVTQHGMKIQLEIFKTESRGWGVRSLSSISSGSFICEYIGELLEDTEAEKRTGNDEYLFDIGKNYNDCSQNPDTTSQSAEIMDAGGFTIDAANYGNVSRFINNSCSPNLYAQNVLFDEEDKRMPHIMLFAMENIPPLQELTYHYNYAVGSIHDSDGNVKVKKCYCGSSECTGRLY